VFGGPGVARNGGRPAKMAVAETVKSLEVAGVRRGCRPGSAFGH
jgi:hypothetical protein